MSTPPGPRGETPAEQPEPEAPTVEGPAVPAAEPAAEREADTAHAAEAPPAATTPANPTRRRRFLGWARTPVGVGVLVAAAMLLFIVIPVGLIGFAGGHEGHGGRDGWGDRAGHSQEYGDRGDGHGDRNWGPRGHRDGGGVQPGNPPGAPATPAPSGSATTSG